MICDWCGDETPSYAEHFVLEPLCREAARVAQRPEVEFSPKGAQTRQRAVAVAHQRHQRRPGQRRY